MNDLLVNVISWALFAGLGALLGWARLRLYPKQDVWEWVILVFLLNIVTSGPNLPWRTAAVGALFGLGYSLKMLFSLRLPLAVSAVLLCSQTFVWILFAAGASQLMKLPFPLDTLCIASLGASLFWLEWTSLPLWGTAQNFACSVPFNRPFIRCVGTAGGTWSLLLVSAWFSTVRKPQNHLWEVAISVAIGLGCVFYSEKFSASLAKRAPKTLRVATFGWAQTSFEGLGQIQTLAREASEQGARLLVTPEAAIHVGNRAEFRVALCTLALKYNLALAIGYFDDAKNENCIDFVNAQGEVAGRYIKTHLVPMMERYNKGRGEIALMEVDGIKVGGVICQDDNFPDIARRYARAGTQLLVVPTNDWKRVKNIHFANHIWRALEFRFALARAASEGISALTSLDGTVETSSDHFQDGAKLLVADVRVGNGKPTFYAKTGDWFPIACGLAAIGGLIFAPK